MTAGELVKKMQALYPHIPIRLSRPGDPELSSMFIHFYPEPMRPKTNLRSESSDSSSEPGKEQPQANKPEEDGS